MGQKTHPKGFRLVTTEKHLSNWYTRKSNYSLLLKEDSLVRRKVEEDLNDFLSISKIEITRVAQENNEKEYVNITIHALFPRAKDMYRKVPSHFLEKLDSSEIKSATTLKNLKKTKNIKGFTSLVLKEKIRNLVRFFQIKTGKNYYFGLKFIKNPFEDAHLIAKFIATQLEKRVPFRRVVKQTIKKVRAIGLKGIKVQVAGRLNGIEIARTEWKRDGNIPLHTLKAKIDYTHYIAETVYGVIGIKIWLFIK